MNKAIYISTTEHYSGKSLVLLGMMQILLRKIKRIGYFRPIINSSKKGVKDNHIETMINHFELDLKYEHAYAFTSKQLIKLKNQGKEDKIIETIIQKYKNIETQFDFILVEGSDLLGRGLDFEVDLNTTIANNLGMPVILVVNGLNKNPQYAMETAQMSYSAFVKRECKVISLVLNKLNEGYVEQVKEQLEKKLPKQIVKGVIPKRQILHNPTVKEIVDNLDAEVLLGEEFLDNRADHFIVGAMQVHNYIKHLKNNCVIISPGDRSDILMSAIQANNSENYPKVSAVILTGGLRPEASIIKLIKGLSSIIPVILVKDGTFNITNRIANIKSKVYSKNKTKINYGINLFEKYVDTNMLENKIITFKTQGMTPKMFQYNIIKRAKEHKKHIVLPEGTDSRILKATEIIIEQDVARLTLLGNREMILDQIKFHKLNIDIENLNIITPEQSDKYASYIDEFYELRKHKGINKIIARDYMSDVSYFGTMMVYKGDADGMVSGATHTTQHTIRPALQLIKTAKGVSTVSSVFFMLLDDKILVYGDCAINPNPNAEQLAEIAISSANTSKKFGLKPKVAMLSYSSGESGKGKDVEKVRLATKLAKQIQNELKIEGPIQYDAAVDKSVGKSKMPNSEVAGQANVLIFPDLNTGNNTYKAVQRETGALAIGPILQGLNKPVNDLSRGCNVKDIVNTIIITALQSE